MSLLNRKMASDWINVSDWLNNLENSPPTEEVKVKKEYKCTGCVQEFETEEQRRRHCKAAHINAKKPRRVKRWGKQPKLKVYNEFNLHC